MMKSAGTSMRLPLFPSREVQAFPIANLPLAEHQRRSVGAAALTVRADVWITPEDVASLLVAGKSTLIDSAGTSLAWLEGTADLANALVAETSFLIRHPWDLLRANEQFVSMLTEPHISGEVHPSAVIEGVLHLGPGTRILPGVFIEGNVVIGTNCKIGPNCYLRGNTSIGDGCHIGQSVEIKNCLILPKTNVGHLSYVGDSVLGEGVNFGAGTTTSNLRHDGGNHRSRVDGVLIDTGRRKLGAIVGDRVHTGINTSIYPGRQLGVGTTTRPGEIVERDLLSQL
jgi:bifunctional UDP-N-acetylglucosamine pyrophosphorylase/glucosamine-1-phosphate N-acetyltransferase